MKKIILKIFNLKGLGFSLDDFEVSDEEIVLEIQVTNQAVYPRCNRLIRSFYERGK